MDGPFQTSRSIDGLIMESKVSAEHPTTLGRCFLDFGCPEAEDALDRLLDRSKSKVNVGCRWRISVKATYQLQSKRIKILDREPTKALKNHFTMVWASL